MIDDHVERKMILNENDWQQCSEKLSVELTQLNFHIKSFNYFIFLFASQNNLSEVYDNKIIYDLFNIILTIIPRPRVDIGVSGWYTADMEQFIY
jgi:hypothetical protein